MEFVLLISMFLFICFCTAILVMAIASAYGKQSGK
jgi:hypothetical protein